jgi:hypothetical protein
VFAGNSTFTSQLIFDQALVGEIFNTHSEYKSYGAPDTSNASDLLARAGTLSSFVLATSRMSDGAMMASKLLVVSGT